ncbi:MAG: phosphate/phosphite/phosphonate ABC transporter substrate-binding protein [Candidatus Rokubacteria bacterium]|nr:phosphate/phosphite/phosphonate ABC transporter substrate-binding protein [Candidatus Rokubacteria bacterium]MBI4254114.1 phosphate/phosphite/phosphonate ABC transporter substrate-binding protein [Candidatus Rokubacteria bacterium]MBI4629730.1 phosphate/phosphite/phosphonate ABC transporter substrate-binding protein [Candidatus Rokubacteria bacterium]
MITRRRPRSIAAAAAPLLLLAAVALALAAEPCAHRGALDPLYCDDNRDLIADPPKDRAKLVSPDPLIFSYVPVEDPAVYENAWSDFLKHLEKATGKRVKYFGLQNYAAQIEAMRSGRLHVAAYSTGSVPYAVNLSGAVPFAIMREPKGLSGYRVALIAAATNDKVNAVADLRGKRVAHVSQTSNSGHQAPVYFFGRMGIVPGKDYQVVFSGKHDTSALGVINGDYDAAAVADVVLDRMVNRGVIKRSDFKVIWTSPVFPTAGFVYAHTLEPRLVEKLREAFFSFSFEGTSVGREFKPRVGFMPLDYRRDWEPVLGVLEANGVVFTKESEDYKRLQKPGRE